MNANKILLLSLSMILLSNCSTIVKNKDTSTERLQTSAPQSIQPEQATKKWWMPRHENKITIKNQMEKIDLVFLGDSITHAFDNKGKKVWQQYYDPRNALNIGFSADRTEHVLWRLKNGAIDNISPQLLVLMIGTNNTGHRQDPAAETALGIKAIIDEIHTQSPKTNVLLLAVFPRGETPNDPLRIINDNINNIIQYYDDGKRIHFLNINHIFLDDKGYLSRDVMKDLLHPNQAQYKRWAEAIEPHVKHLMKTQ